MNSSTFTAPLLPIQSQLEATVSQWVADHPLLPGAIVGVWQEGYQPWRAAFGVSNLDTQAPMQVDNHMRIGSITKTFTGTVVLQLVDEGKLSLDDKAIQYIPELSQLLNGKGGEITIRQLGNHTSGIYNYTDEAFDIEQLADPFKFWTPEELLQRGLQNEPFFNPGEGWQYSNTNSLLLGLIVEKITGNAFELELQERILDPLGMTETFWPTNGDIPTPYSHGYKYLSPSSTTSIDVTNWNPTWGDSAGQLISTLDDLFRYAKPLATGALLSSPETRAEQQRWVAVDPAFKYGFQIADFGGGAIGHNGTIDGYQSFMVYLPEWDMTVIVLANSNGIPDEGKLIGPADALGGLIINQIKQTPPSSNSCDQFAYRPPVKAECDPVAFCQNWK